MAYPAPILTKAALGEGVETHLFFTFLGFDMINKTMGELKFTMLGNTATHLLQGLVRRARSKASGRSRRSPPTTAS